MLPHSPAHGHHGAADVARSVPELAPRAFRRVQGRPHRPVRGEGGNSQALRRASPRSPTAVFSPHGTSIAVAHAPAPPSRLPQESKHLGPEDALEKIKEGVEAESFIRLHVVQAVGNERGNYEMRIEAQHVDGEYEAPGAGGCAGEAGKKNA